MNRITLSALALLLFRHIGGGQIIFHSPLSPRLANYTISAVLDPDRKQVRGSETLVWRNHTRDRINELRMHLYLNAFSNPQSTFMKESVALNRRQSFPEEWGWIRIDSMDIPGSADLTGKIEYIHPDDDNADDRTVIRVPLPKPVLPGASVTVDIRFVLQLPTIVARTGYHKNFFMVAQWYPKIGVYEAAGERYAVSGGWNCHQFHAETEFFADYGVYNVALTVPQQYTVGAVGVLQQEKQGDHGTKTLTYRAEDVHDFSWTASPDFAVVEDQWNGIQIHLLTQQYKIGGISGRYLQSIKAALRRYQDCIAPYPYPGITIVDPPYLAMNAGGMEYPTLITGESMWGMPEGYRIVELVTIHEFGHQYWYGMVGSNEFEEAWLDEGFTQYYENRLMDAEYGAQSAFIDIAGFRSGDFETTRSDYTHAKNPKIEPILQPAWMYKAGGYGTFTYSKGSTVLTTLDRMVGRAVMDEIMRTYFTRWKFRHPCTRDFIAVVNEIVPKRLGAKFGPNMNWYFDQVLSGTDVCDYELTRIDALPSPEDRSDGNSPSITSRVRVSRLGEVKMPVDLLVRFSDGRERRDRWNGQDRYHDFFFTDTCDVATAVVDPDNVIALDIDRNNNSKTADRPSFPIWKYAVKFMTFTQTLLQYLNVL